MQAGVCICKHEFVILIVNMTDMVNILSFWSSYQNYVRVLPCDIIQGFVDGLVQDCSNFIALAVWLMQSCTKPSTYLDLFMTQGQPYECSSANEATLNDIDGRIPWIHISWWHNRYKATNKNRLQILWYIP